MTRPISSSYHGSVAGVLLAYTGVKENLCLHTCGGAVGAGGPGWARRWAWLTGGCDPPGAAIRRPGRSLRVAPTSQCVLPECFSHASRQKSWTYLMEPVHWHG
jgi:hypothetical protein